MAGRIGSDLARSSRLQVGDVEPSIYAGDEVEASKDELLSGMKVTALILNDAIKLADGLILMTSPTWRANCRCFLLAILLMGQVIRSQA